MYDSSQQYNDVIYTHAVSEVRLRCSHPHGCCLPPYAPITPVPPHIQQLLQQHCWTSDAVYVATEYYAMLFLCCCFVRWHDGMGLEF